jgi:histidinol-phosphate aminotransferase
MMDWISQRMKIISRIERYSKPEKSPSIKLDANENLVLDRNFLSQLAMAEVNKIDLRKYPLDLYDKLYESLSKYLRVGENNLLIGNGSDQIIELLLTFIGSGKRVTLPTPTFSYFVSRCQLHGIKILKIPLLPESNTFERRLFMSSAKNSQLVYLCSPNNPTGNQLDRSIIQEILELKDVLVILDEAYVEFAKYSMTRSVEKYDNLVILRTFSKAFGLAGSRIGYFISNKRFSKFIRTNVQSPYPVNSLSLALAISVISNVQKIKECVDLIKRERQRLYERISKMDWIITYQSDANFIFIRCKRKYKSIINSLRSHGIGVKELGELHGYGKCIRITVGTPEMNDATISALNDT